MLAVEPPEPLEAVPVTFNLAFVIDRFFDKTNKLVLYVFLDIIVKKRPRPYQLVLRLLTVRGHTVNVGQ